MAAQITFRRSGASEGLSSVHITTCKAYLAECQGEQNGWVTNLSSKEVSQRQHRFYRDVQNPPRVCNSLHAVELSLTNSHVMSRST